jgi:hypothetical protein
MDLTGGAMDTVRGEKGGCGDCQSLELRTLTIIPFLFLLFSLKGYSRFLWACKISQRNRVGWSMGNYAYLYLGLADSKLCI